MTGVAAAQRCSRRTPCLVCGGGDDMPRGKGKRCSGYLSDDGRFAYCSREEFAGGLDPQQTDPPTFRHYLADDCRCGTAHGPASPNGARAEIVATYDYVDQTGKLLFQVVRFAPKRFLQRRPDGAGGWHWNLDGVERVLYRLPRVLEQAAQAGAGVVYVVEGEKDVSALERAGAVATTCPGGAGKWRPEYSLALKGADVTIVADNDPAGVEHARAVAASLQAANDGSSPPTRLVRPAAGNDVSDHLAAGLGLDELASIDLEPAEPAPASFRLEVITARKLATLEVAAGAEPLVGPFVRRAMETLIGGPTGHGKTTWIAQAVKAAAAGGDFLGHQVAGGEQVLVLDLEQHLASIQRVIREAGLDESETVDYAPIPEGLALDKRSDQLAAVEKILAAKPYGLVVVDPFYKLHEADSSDELQARLLVALLRRWIAEHGFALLTATHCRKLPAGRNAITNDDLFGSSLFTRDPEIVLGIQRHGDLTKLHVFKSREPDLDHGQTFELLFTRGRGFWIRPTKDPEEIEAENAELRDAVTAYITEHPGHSTNAIQTAMKASKDRVKDALLAQVKSGLLPEPIEGSRNSRLWYPLNHAALTSPESLLGEVSGDAAQGQAGDDFTRPPVFPVGEREGRGGEVDEAPAESIDEDEVERLAAIAREDENGPQAASRSLDAGAPRAARAEGEAGS